MTNFPARHAELQSIMPRLASELRGPIGGFANLHKAATADGTLNTKTKELIALVIAVAGHCEPCIAYHVHDALRAGASRAEMLEALGVAVMMGGGPAAMYACDAFVALEQFESANKASDQS
ncbi:MAG TPA: carboxymuconolactone decarboxylase family protein [Xanthobacteraceae bacterium]|nr:carboxymuconolactone decarboxylase family protein [Xanthobacteraceae bacterium]